LGFATGAAAILTRHDGRDRWLSLPFGVALGLTADELGLLLEHVNPCWGTEKLALAQCAAASLGSAALAAAFTRRGVKATAPSGPSRYPTPSPA
jgi:hypothetical protein